MKRDVRILTIDAQMDFCDPKAGALFVPGADGDCIRLAAMIRKCNREITDIHATLDTHHHFDIGHPAFWLDQNNNHPVIYDKNHIPTPVIITCEDLKSGKWRTYNPVFQEYAIKYSAKLSVNNRYPMIVWPPHCLIGSPGHCVHPAVWAAFNEWEVATHGFVDYVTKGSNFLKEHYSAVKADVPECLDPNVDVPDPSVQLNTRLIETLEEADVIGLTGEALSHCVANTVRDIADGFGNQDYIRKLVLILDTTSSVPSFEQYSDEFIQEMTGRGMQTTTHDKFHTFCV